MTTDVYHPGELAAQTRAGARLQGGHSGRAVRTRMPDAAREFLHRQVMLVLGAADPAGRMWATPLTGREGFVRTEDASTVTVAAAPPPGDPLRERLTEGATPGPGTPPVPVGAIAVEPATRRRMRMNGLAEPTGYGLRLRLEQVYANCPRHIQGREVVRRETAAPADGAGRALRASALTARQRELIAGADTFFVATADADGHADASHRGGLPGFVEVLSPTTLRWPDYAGNAMFNTLGNLEVNPSAGLLFPDWSTGTLLHLTGTARTDWDSGRAAAVPGAERLVEFTVTEVAENPGGSPLRWSAPEPSRHNPPAAAPGRTGP
ncbi:pyridoxamine 5'-phosphate oxidase family protein [Streptomyces sp. TRM 70351]|uniref:pyridoxamine 5'-phosphate oxidase family protein n=1 Tax=Streptomyces sp. TRM 70351 TaxID=3116552 RepID=UPI002E7C45DC|nr:pyridoxamine 5'-phosphate oxidase family protein [Streptomyces sp. TRM 70351]MEE1930092.1 pyridoxamine 5'-phosphate oxidase family protein [Streptomyces sp. TRM 70351]